MTSFAELRDAFPVLGRVAYLNAGTCGPIAQASADASIAELRLETERGRAGDSGYFPHLLELLDRQRAAYAQRLRARPEDIALTTATSDGIVRVLAGLDLGPGDEIITSDEEHPGLLGPLAEHIRRDGCAVRIVPFDDLADAVGPSTRLVATSHVSWINGKLAPAALAELPDDVPVLLDGAQGAGAIDVDVSALGCAFYAAAGQKWLCGPIGTGLLYVAPAWAERLPSIGPTYLNLETPAAGLQAEPHHDARRHDAAALSGEGAAFAVAADDTLAAAGWLEVHERAVSLAQQFADALAEQGRTIAPRGPSTLVSFEDPDPPATRDRLAQAGVVVRDLPGHPYLRLSVGAWNDESDLDRLLEALAS